jgi:hypothetical protein
MPAVRTPHNPCPKAVVSVSEMARMCGLSRIRFYDLIEQRIMPSPCYDPRTKRPIYTKNLQRQCLDIKRTNVGIEGQFIIFYQRRSADERSPAISRSRRLTTAASAPGGPQRHTQLIAQLASLGLPGVTDAQVDTGFQVCFPSGHDGVDEGEVLRTLWRYLRQASAA